MKSNDFANNVLVFLKAYPKAEPYDLIKAGIGRSPEEIAFVVEQLRIFGYI